MMKLRNKKTGKVLKMQIHNIGGKEYNSLTEINEEWEDYEEPKEYWYICSTRDYEITRVNIDEGTDFDRVQKDKEIGNYFETLEEAEEAVERLRAWKRLKDKGFRFERWRFSKDEPKIIIKGNCVPDIVEELDLLFSGGEE